MPKKVSKDYSYPKPGDDNFQSNLYNRREFYYHKVPKRDKFTNYEDIQEYRNNTCKKGAFRPREQQALLPNFLSPETPYKGVVLIHGTGSGKTASAITIAEQFKEQAKKYDTKIYILTFGPASKEGWKSDLLFATRDTYLKDQELLDQLPKKERIRKKNTAVYQAFQNYTILSYMTFYKKVLGEKISEKTLANDNTIKTTYIKNEEGEIERELVVDRITNMDNSLIIVDESHNLTGNEYGLALKKIIEKSKNLRVILLTATPMKNLADNIIELINFLRPKKNPILRERVFTSEKNYMMKFKPGGEEYLQKMANGYISYYRGDIPFTFAKQVDKGEVIEGLLFTHVVQCFMEKFQLETYKKTEEEFKDGLDRKSSAAANFVFPGAENNKLKGYFSSGGINKVLGQLDMNQKDIIKVINKDLFKNKISKSDLENFIKIGENKNVVGNILKLDYLKHFSIKFYKCIKRLNRLVNGDKGSGIAFIYSNLVKAGGIEVFADCLKANGYLEYNDNGEYAIEDNTLDALTGLTFKDFNKKYKDKTFYPATYLLVTGGSEESIEDSQEEKQRIIREVYNNVGNIDGNKLKFVLGSKVMNEGITLENVREIHILDVHYNLGKVKQVIGRGIRMCKHQNSITESNKYPEVNVYRYVVSTKSKDLSSDERLYQKAEKKYLLVKRTERLLKEVAIDCPLLLHSNMFPEEIEEYKNCVPPTMENKRKGKKICPELFNFDKPDFQCKDPELNKKYWDKKKGTYRDLAKDELNYGTFNKKLALIERQNMKDKIRDLYKFKSLYKYEEIVEKVKKTLNKHQQTLFELDLLDLALDDLMPESENEFNNFRDTVIDKYNRTGYLIKKDNYYLFQPFDMKETASLFFRENMDIKLDNPASLENYLKEKHEDKLKKNLKEIKEDKDDVKKGYDFESVMDYYENRNEYDLVGIIEKNLNKLARDDIDVFKIRKKMPKNLTKRRQTGVPKLTGAVCSTSKDKKELLKMLAKLPNATKDLLKKVNNKKRDYICEIIKQKLMFLEKYSTSKEKNKMTYLMMPANHPRYNFPFNLEDRIKYVLDYLQKETGIKIKHSVKKMNNGIFMNRRDKEFVKYELTFSNSKLIEKEKVFIEKYGGKLNKGKWVIIME